MTAYRYPRPTITLWIVLLAALNCTLIPWIGWAWLSPRDFGVFYAAAQIYLHNAPNTLYSPDVQRQTEKQLYGIPDNQLSKRFMPYNHLPYEVVLWLPLIKLSPDHAFWAWRLESACLLLFTVWLFAKAFPMRNSPGGLFIIALAFFPVPFCFLGGQDTFVTLALFTISLWLLKQKSNGLAGVVLGLCLFKPQLVLPIIGIFFLLRSRRVLVGFASSAGAVLAISASMVGRRGMSDLLHLWVKGETGGVACINPVTMPNVRGLLSCIPDLSPNAAAVTSVIISVMLLLLAAHQARNAPTSTHLFAIAVCFTVLVSFHTNLYDLAILILPALVLLETYTSSKRSEWKAMLPLIVLFCPVTYVVALAVFRVALLAVVVACLWSGLVVTMKREEVSAMLAVPPLPEPMPNRPGVSRI